MRTGIRIGFFAGIAVAAMPAWGASRAGDAPATRHVSTTQAAPHTVAAAIKTAGVGSGVDFLLFDDAPVAASSTAPAAAPAAADRPSSALRDRSHAPVAQARAVR